MLFCFCFCLKYIFLLTLLFGQLLLIFILRLANELEDRQLFEDSGDILEHQKQYSEAAAMFIKGQQFERAAFMYTKYLIRADKSRITEAVVVMAKVNNDQLNSAFAKACVAAGRFDEAARAYERAKDMDKVVELKLRHLDQVRLIEFCAFIFLLYLT